MPRVIAMWSGPRNLSTAMMRSFGARPDCAVMDEPFFAPFLAATGKDHPGREETLARHETDPAKVALMCTRPQTDKPFSFQKHMPHHMQPDFPMDWAKDAKHFFLIREPQRVIASYLKGRNYFEYDDLGFAPQRRLFEQISEMLGQTPPVIDSTDILHAPEAALKTLCEALDIPFYPDMLSWPKGLRAEDGAWAPYWYDSVVNSTGFTQPPETLPNIPSYHERLLKMCNKDYAQLAANKLVFD